MPDFENLYRRENTNNVYIIDHNSSLHNGTTSKLDNAQISVKFNAFKF